MSDPIAAADQASREIACLAQIHASYYLGLLERGVDHESALSMMQTLMWVHASRDSDDDF